MYTQVYKLGGGKMSIDKKNFVPIYLQIGEDIKSNIISGKYKEGDRLPSESELISKYNVTRTTIQRALSVLVNEGFIERIHGKGTFVRIRSVRNNIWNFSSFSEHAKKTNQKAITRVITHEVYTHQQENFLKLVRLRGFEKQNKAEWITLDTSILSLTVFPSLDQYDFSDLSLYEVMKNKYDIHPSNARLSVHAIHSNEQLMHFFELKSSTPLLNVKGDTYDEQGNVIEKVNVVFNSTVADFNFVIDI